MSDVQDTVEVRLGDASRGEPRAYVRCLDPETGTSDELSLDQFMERTEGKPAFRMRRMEVNRRVRVLEKEKPEAPAPVAEKPAESIAPQERVDRLREYLRQHPATRLMDLEIHPDAERGPLYILAKRMVERGELVTHPKTGALTFPGGPMPAEKPAPAEPVTVKITQDLPAIAGATTSPLKKGDLIELPVNVATALMGKGAAMETSEVPCPPTAAPEAPTEPIKEEARAISGKPRPAGTHIGEPIKLNDRTLRVALFDPDGRYIDEKYRVEVSYEGGKIELQKFEDFKFWLKNSNIPKWKEIYKQTEGAAIALDSTPKLEGIEADLMDKEKMDATARNQAEREADDLGLLKSGAWWNVVDGAIDEFLAGEPMLRKIAVYSALSGGLNDNRIPLMAIGDSQMGKSYALRSIGSKLFPSIFIDAAAMSGKALFYAAQDNPKHFDGKILMLDELADQSEGTLNFLKAGMSSGAKELTNMTVDEHKKSKVQIIEGLPIFWSTSAEVLEDAEGQLMKRPFVVNPDESAEQTGKIQEFQMDAASINLVRAIESKIPRAQKLLEKVLEDKSLAVYNLFARHVRISNDDARARNTLPMFFNLVAAIAYAHRFARPAIELPNGRRLLFASYEDNKEAAEIWAWASGPKSTGLPARHIELLKVLPIFAGSISGGLTLDEIVEAYSKSIGRKVAHKTVRNYLSELSAKDLATYYEAEDKNGKELNLWYSLGSSHAFPTSSQLLIGMESTEGNKYLDKALEELKGASSQFPDEIQLKIAELREELFGGASR